MAAALSAHQSFVFRKPRGYCAIHTRIKELKVRSGPNDAEWRSKCCPLQALSCAGRSPLPPSPMYASHQASPPSRRTPSRRASSKPVPNPSDSPTASSVLPEFPDKQAPTFTSCLSIPVEGAVPIERTESSPATASHAVNGQGSTSESKRAPRKSKTDALQALQHHAQASNHSQDDLSDNMQDDAGVRVKLRDGPPISVKSKLDISTVKTPNPRASPSRPRERPFGLSDCPTFRPTPEQFKDPLAYIKSISENARTYGMCKIVPPLGWDMPFVTDTEVCSHP